MTSPNQDRQAGFSESGCSRIPKNICRVSGMSQHNAALAGEWRVGGFEPA
jgi:hypothetical protein